MLRRHAIATVAGIATYPLLMRSAAAQTAASSGMSALSQRILAASTFATTSSQLALTKAESPIVKVFAKFEVAEQESILRATQLAGITVPQSVQLDSEQAQMLQQLQGLSNAEFDRMYVRGQLAGHQELLTLHQRRLTAGTRDEQIISTIAVATIEQHIAMLQAQ
ncbi:MAG: hypothetical protein JWP20_581 [Roseomonas sp.]|jgi:putative membrane protein|nr:hypothetical protein [Roseomonas sp.]